MRLFANWMPDQDPATEMTFSDDGREATLWEVVGGDWVRYEKIDGSATYACKQVRWPTPSFCKATIWSSKSSRVML